MQKSTKENIDQEIRDLIKLGSELYYRLIYETYEINFDDPPLDKDEDEADAEYNEYLEVNQKKIATYEKVKELAAGVQDFAIEYEKFYTLGLKVVRAISPDRLDDFIKQYKDDRRKEVSAASYLISDAIVGYKHTFGGYSKASAIPRMLTQISILKAVRDNLSKSLNDIDALIRADLFDSELDSASYLLKHGHIRAAGAVAGVVLETHLGVIAERHGFKSRKKNPTIAEYIEFLKTEGVIDVVVWRRIQSLADIRNLCDHQKGREPSKDDVTDLIAGVNRIIKEVY